MSTEATTPAPEVKGPETTVQTTQETTTSTETPKVESAPTVADMLGKKQPESVPLARLNKEIQRKKELEVEVAKLREQVANNTQSEASVASDIKKLAAEHNVDADFLDKLVSTIKAETSSSMEEKLRPLTEREDAERVDRAFTEHFNKTLEGMPEFKEIVNPIVIKQMALNPENANKTFQQLIEDAYGNVVVGKRSLETGTPRGGGSIDKVDFDRARNDTAYFKEVMANPTLKQQYNDSITSRVRL